MYIKDKKILLGVTGGVAAYKAADLASRLSKLGAEVQVVLTANACRFISPLTFSSLTGVRALTESWDFSAAIAHIELPRRADMVVIAPASANFIGKMAHGLADDLLSTIMVANTKPTLIVPAMNCDMFANAAVQENIQVLQKRGAKVLLPDYGRMACRDIGRGRYPDNDEIIIAMQTLFHRQNDLTGQTVLITAGAGREDIDPMRFISNRSSGKMGLALARAAYLRGAKVKLVCGHLDEKPPYYLEVVHALSANKMQQAVYEALPGCTAVIMCAAVSDFTPVNSSNAKIKKSEKLSLELVKAPDILAGLRDKCDPETLLVGFAAETDNLHEYARQKMTAKRLDMIVANMLTAAGADHSEIHIFTREHELHYAGDKLQLAQHILDAVPWKTV